MAETPKNLFQDQLLRREAGEGWFAEEPDKTLLGALVVREALMDELVEEKDETTWKQYEDQVKLIRDLKEELGIGDPPPVSEE
jgi:hypothetical protein